METFQRFRQLRQNQTIRNQHAEVVVDTNDLILPFFVVDGHNIKNAIRGFDGVFHLSVNRLLFEIEHAIALGIRNFLLFGVPESKKKDNHAKYGYNSENMVCHALREIKKRFNEACLYTDVCLCAYTLHGHCGVVSGNDIDNDSTLPLLGKIAVSHAQAGADWVAPSAMMDGQVYAIREALNQEGFRDTKILAYSAKYASSFYGPFRYIAHSAPSFGDRKTYQMDYENKTQAAAEVLADIAEGADATMVKPAHSYLDVIAELAALNTGKPLAAYHVSGEYMMLKSAAAAGVIDEKQAVHECLTAIKRAGANKIITYYANWYAANCK